MQELLLLAAMIVIMIFGDVVMKRLDGFLERNGKEQEAREQAPGEETKNGKHGQKMV